MSGELRRKWRPPLALVIGGTLAAVLALPVLGIAWLRLAGNILGWAETAWLVGWIAVVATAVLGWLLWRLVLRPVWALTAHARAIKAGQAEPPPLHFGTPEFRDLGQSVVEMGDALNARARSLSAYADHVTHELRSPLTALRASADLLADDDLPPEDRAALLAAIDSATHRMEVLLRDLRTHAAARLTAQPGHSSVTDALALADIPDVLTIQNRSDVTLPLTAGDLARVLTQMARNAHEHGATTLEITAQNGGLCLSDDGTGIAEGDKARIFDPFFTTKRDSGGTGMGLSIACTLVEAAGGQITLIEKTPGAHFLIIF